MNKQNTDFRKAKKKLNWLRDMYSSHTYDELFLFELKIILQNDTEHLLPVLGADKIHIKDWYNRSVYVMCYKKGNLAHEKAISYVIIDKVVEMMKQNLEKLENKAQN